MFKILFYDFNMRRKVDVHDSSSKNKSVEKNVISFLEENDATQEGV